MSYLDSINGDCTDTFIKPLDSNSFPNYSPPSQHSDNMHTSYSWKLSIIVFFIGILSQISSTSASSKLSKYATTDSWVSTTPRRHFTRYWAVEINGTEEHARQIANKYGFVYLRQIMPGIFYFKHRRVSKRSIHHSALYERRLSHDPEVRWVEQQVARIRVKRDVYLNDPQWPYMWYLNRAQYGDVDMNVRRVWDRGFTGEGVVVTILDDGLEKNHLDLRDNYDPLASYDVNSNDANPEPRYIPRRKDSRNGQHHNVNQHGTRCAGTVAAAANNSVCGVGIAYRARIGGVRMLDGDVTDAIEAESLGLQKQHVDIYSASWGPEDDGMTVDGPGKLACKAFENGIRQGRGGLGSIYVWASGNGGRNHDNCNCDGYTNSIYTLSVSSTSERGQVPWYAEFCSSTMAVTFSSGEGSERSVISTDLNNTCTNEHSGTSASAPLAAGICALVLSANRRLTWRDMQHLVVRTARPESLQYSNWMVNGVGRHVSHAFGYGLMDAAAMVDLALNWTTVPEQHVCEVVTPSLGASMNLNDHSSDTLYLHTDGCRDKSGRRVRYLEHVQAKVTLQSTIRGEVELWLISPMDTVSKLLSKRHKDLTAAGFYAWPFMSVHYWGERPEGTWKLTVASGGAKVTVRWWALVLYGTEHPPSHPLMGSKLSRHHTRPIKRGGGNRTPRNQSSGVGHHRNGADFVFQLVPLFVFLVASFYRKYIH